MKEDQDFYSDGFTQAKDIKKGKNGAAQPGGHTHAIEYEKKGQSNPLLLRLQEVERLNANLEKLLDQRNKELADVVAANAKSISIIGHDLRSPFSSVLTALELIKYDMVHQDTGEMEHFINVATGSAYSAINLLDNLAEWAMLQNKGLKFNPVKTNLKEVIGNETENLRTFANQKQIGLNFSISPDLNLDIDVQMVRTILRNLISNAIKFTNDGGEVELEINTKKILP